MRSFDIYFLSIYIFYSYYFTFTLNDFKRLYSQSSNQSKLSNQYKKEHELTQEQKEAIVGIMLADGFLEREKPTYNTRLRIDHVYPEQESCVLSLHSLFASLIAMEPVINERKADPRTGKAYKSIYVRTLRFPCLNKYHDLFYKDKKKVVPSNIQDLLTPRGLAHLIMGDGFFLLDKGVVVLCTESFTKEEQELLVTVLNSKFGIKATLNKRVSSSSTESFRIRISKKSMDKLISLVKPYLIPKMLYKLGL